jgi:hypothetical protein
MAKYWDSFLSHCSITVAKIDIFANNGYNKCNKFHKIMKIIMYIDPNSANCWRRDLGEAAATMQRNTFGNPGWLDRPDLRAQWTLTDKSLWTADRTRSFSNFSLIAIGQFSQLHTYLSFDTATLYTSDLCSKV